MTVGTPMVMVVMIGTVMVEVLVAVITVEEEDEVVVPGFWAETVKAKQAAAMIEAAENFIFVGGVSFGEWVSEWSWMRIEWRE